MLHIVNPTILAVRDRSFGEKGAGLARWRSLFGGFVVVGRGKMAAMGETADDGGPPTPSKTKTAQVGDARDTHKTKGGQVRAAAGRNHAPPQPMTSRRLRRWHEPAPPACFRSVPLCSATSGANQRGLGDRRGPITAPPSPRRTGGSCPAEATVETDSSPGPINHRCKAPSEEPAWSDLTPRACNTTFKRTPSTAGRSWPPAASQALRAAARIVRHRVTRLWEGLASNVLPVSHGVMQVTCFPRPRWRARRRVDRSGRRSLLRKRVSIRTSSW